MMGNATESTEAQKQTENVPESAEAKESASTTLASEGKAEAKAAKEKASQNGEVKRDINRSESQRSVKDQIKDHATELNAMNPVADVTVESMADMSSTEKTAYIMGIYDQRFSNGGIQRDDIGFVEIGKQQVKDSYKYLRTEEEYMALVAVPNVISEGQIIYERSNHKERGYSTVTIAAPVIINGKRGNLAVVLKHTKNLRYKVHRIVSPDGSVFSLEKAEAEPTTISMPTARVGEEGLSISSASNTIVTDSAKNVNTSSEKNTKRSIETESKSETETEMTEKEKAKTEAEAKKKADADLFHKKYFEAEMQAIEDIDGFQLLPQAIRDNVVAMYIDAKDVKGVSKKVQKALASIIVARPGLRFFFSDELADNGAFLDANGDRYIVVNSKDAGAIAKALVHEITHDLHYEGSKAYEKLATYVLSRADKKDRERITFAYRRRELAQYDIVDADATVEQVNAAYQRLKIESPEAAKAIDDVVKEEIVTNTVAGVIGNQKFVERLAKTNKSVFMRAIAHLRALKASIFNRSEADVEMRKIEKMWTDAAFRTDAEAKSYLATVDKWVESEVKRSIDIDSYTEKQYNDFGWARANDVLTDYENSHAHSLFMRVTANTATAPKSKSGEYMIAVGDGDINNKIVFMKGTPEDPIITRVLHIDADNETTLSDIRSEVYASERKGIRQKARGLFSLYASADYRSERFRFGNSSQEIGYNDGLDTDRGRSGRKTQKIKRVSFNEDGSIKKIVYRSIDIPDISDRILMTEKERSKLEKAKDKAKELRGTPIKETAKNVASSVKKGAVKAEVLFTNAQAGIEDHLINVAGRSRSDVEASTNMMRASAGKARNATSFMQTDFEGNVIGDGISKIVARVTDRNDFGIYWAHVLNASRATRGKNVFIDVTEEQSLAYMEEKEKQPDATKNGLALRFF